MRLDKTILTYLSGLLEQSRVFCLFSCQRLGSDTCQGIGQVKPKIKLHQQKIILFNGVNYMLYEKLMKNFENSKKVKNETKIIIMWENCNFNVKSFKIFQRRNLNLNINFIKLRHCYFIRRSNTVLYQEYFQILSINFNNIQYLIIQFIYLLY